MKKWEYAASEATILDMDELGQEGWELVCVHGNTAYFKREVKQDEPDIVD